MSELPTAGPTLSNDASERPGSLLDNVFVKLGILGLALSVFVIPFPYAGQTIDRLLDFGHIIFFAAFGFLMMKWLERSLCVWRRTVLVILLGSAIGILIEFVQPYFGRRLSLHDIWADIGGTTSGVLVALALIQELKTWRGVFVILALLSCLAAAAGVFAAHHS